MVDVVVSIVVFSTSTLPDYSPCPASIGESYCITDDDRDDSSYQLDGLIYADTDMTQDYLTEGEVVQSDFEVEAKKIIKK